MAGKRWQSRIAIGVLTDTQPSRYLRNRIAPLGDLRHRVPFEIITESSCAHHGLLSSNLGKKASTKLGAIQSAPKNIERGSKAALNKLYLECQ